MKLRRRSRRRPASDQGAQSMHVEMSAGKRAASKPARPRGDATAERTRAPRARVLGAVAPQRRILRGPVACQQRSAAESPGEPHETRFVANLEVLDALLASADDSLVARMSRLGMRRRQAHRFIIAATGRLLRVAQRASRGRELRIGPPLLEEVDVAELSSRTRVAPRLVSGGLAILLPELAALVARLRR